MDKKRSPDLLNDLPLSVINIVLSLVPIRDVVRTSVLSSQWRYIWASLPYLAFDKKCVPPLRGETEFDGKRLIHFISQTLLLHKGPIYNFQLLLPSTEESHCVDQWLLFLSRNDVKNLVLEYDGFRSCIDVRPSLYSFQNLTHLKLRVQTILPPPPSFKGFLLLRSLDIEVVEVDSGTIESIVAQSPLLEELTLGRSPSVKMTIHALNLKYLYCHLVHDLTLCTPLLQKFYGCYKNAQFFSIGVESMVFHHLRNVGVSDVPFDNGGVAHGVIRLITGSPNLQKLVISGDPFEDLDEDEDEDVDEPEPEPDFSWDAESAPDFTYNSLKVIKMDRFGGYMDEMKLVEFLLARTPELETLMSTPGGEVSRKKLLNITIQLLSYRRASANAQIVFRRYRRLY